MTIASRQHLRDKFAQDWDRRLELRLRRDVRAAECDSIGQLALEALHRVHYEKRNYVIWLADRILVHGGDKAGQWIVGGVPMRAV
jgi:hypothetical protein